MSQDPDRPDSVKNWTYIYDFLNVFKSKNTYQDWLHVLTEIKLAMRSAPSYPELTFVAKDALHFEIDFPDGRLVVIEFEMDKRGRIEPVMGGSNQD